MIILAEISDKMHSLAEIVIVSLIAASLSVALAWTRRAMAWAVLLLTSVVGIAFAFGGYHESFVDGPFSDAIWRELGASWVAASIAGPLFPVICVTAVLFLRPWPPQGRGCSLERPPGVS